MFSNCSLVKDDYTFSASGQWNGSGEWVPIGQSLLYDIEKTSINFLVNDKYLSAWR